MTLTLEYLVDAVARMLKSHFPDTKVYSNPNQQGTKAPCFFVFFMPSDMEGEMNGRMRRVIGVDVVYLTKRNIPDAYDRLTAVADRLDEAMEKIPYGDAADGTGLRTFDREWKIDDGELHYQFTVKAIVSQPSGVPAVESIEGYKGGIKGAGKEREKDRGRKIPDGGPA